MKVTRLGQATPLLSATSLGGSGGTLDPVVGGGLVPTASGSNSWSWGSNVSLITANGSNSLIGPFVNFAAGSNITLAVSSNTMTIAGTGGGGGGAVATDTIWDAKGDLAVGTGADAASRLAVGTNGHVLTADSTQSTGVKWAAEATGSRTFAFFGG